MQVRASNSYVIGADLDRLLREEHGGEQPEDLAAEGREAPNEVAGVKQRQHKQRNRGPDTHPGGPCQEQGAAKPRLAAGKRVHEAIGDHDRLRDSDDEERLAADDCLWRKTGREVLAITRQCNRLWTRQRCVLSVTRV